MTTEAKATCEHGRVDGQSCKEPAVRVVSWHNPIWDQPGRKPALSEPLNLCAAHADEEDPR
jgi:hypothetical protein